MKIIADSNIIYSALLSKDNICQFIILSEQLEFFSPNFMIMEIFKHKERILKSSKLPEDELLSQFERILARITFVKEEIIPMRCYLEAYQLCKEIDENDVAFVALAIFMNCQFLTGDKAIYEGLKKQNSDVISIPDIAKLINL